jgi:branched-chain amino acid transport system ATP-binding protein
VILEIDKVTASYGASQVLFGVDLNVEEAETVCILGRNGVGKTTTIKTVMGILKPRSGSIKFKGTDISGMARYKINRLGISYMPQGRQIFPNLTARENLILAERKGTHPDTDWTMPKIYQLFPSLKNREGSWGKSLSGGEQQMLCIARGLMQNPKLLLMDEICEGLAPIVVQELERVIKQLRDSGVSILIAEQNAKFAMAVSHRCYILEKGQVVYQGISSEIPPEIFRKYLGT